MHDVPCNSKNPWGPWLTSSLARLESASQLRKLYPVIPSLSSVDVEISHEVLADWLGGESSALRPYSSLKTEKGFFPLKLFSLNDYLGLSTHPAVREAAAAAAQNYGNGPRSSALVGGYTQMHRELEEALAELKGTQDCLLFPTGFAANLGTVLALAGDGAVIFSDELNHASIIDGARLAARSNAQLQVYRHNDMAHLEELLEASGPGKRRLVVTDTLFSMDGDFADLAGLAALRKKHGFLLVADEAHATLVCGERGGGAVEAAGVCEDVDVHVGTLSKAVGSQGGFVACSADMKRLLMNRGRPYVFSTALTLPSVAAAQAALVVNRQEPWRREHLWRLVERLGVGLGVVATSPIVPIVIGPEALALSAARDLLRNGFHVPAIRPPTVAPGTSRLRVSLSAAHTMEDVDALVAAISQCRSATSPGMDRGPVLTGAASPVIFSKL